MSSVSDKKGKETAPFRLGGKNSTVLEPRPPIMITDPSGRIWLVAYHRPSANSMSSSSSQSQGECKELDDDTSQGENLRIFFRPSRSPPVWRRVPSGRNWPEEHQVSVRIFRGRIWLVARSRWTEWA